MQAGPYLYRPEDHEDEIPSNTTSLVKRGWKMVDDGACDGVLARAEAVDPR